MTWIDDEDMDPDHEAEAEWIAQQEEADLEAELARGDEDEPDIFPDDGPPAEWEQALPPKDASPQTATEVAEHARPQLVTGGNELPPPPEGASEAEWNAWLVQCGEGEVYDTTPSERELDHRLRRRPHERDTEPVAVADHFGTEETEDGRRGYGIGTLPLEGPRRSARRRPPAAVRVYSNGRHDKWTYQRIGADTEAIEEWLGRAGGLESFRGCMGRGRPSEAKRAAKVTLAASVRDLLNMGAYATAIGSVLGCGREAVAALAKYDTSNL